jgi:hypothetical protein
LSIEKATAYRKRVNCRNICRNKKLHNLMSAPKKRQTDTKTQANVSTRSSYRSSAVHSRAAKNSKEKGDTN